MAITKILGTVIKNKSDAIGFIFYFRIRKPHFFMFRKAILLFFVLFFFFASTSQAQDTTWTLQHCSSYAMEHNLDLSQNILNERMAKLQYNQNRLSQIPSLSINGNYGKSFGRSIDPTSNQFINMNYNFAGANGNLNVLLFGWFSKRENIQQDKLSFKAAESDYEQLKDDISLNVATGFLRILLAKEQIGISKEQVNFSLEQKNQTQAFVDAGRSSELDLAQINVQVATDSTAYFNALNNYQQAILQLKALMNLDMNQSLNIVAPQISQISLKVLTNNQPEQIFEIAKNNFNSIKSSQLKIAAARKGLASQKGNLYPSLSFGLQAGSNFSSTQREIFNPQITGVEPTGNFIDVGTNRYLVMQPKVDYDMEITPFFKQLKTNFRQTAALTISVPIFNGWASQTAVKQAKIDVQNKINEGKQAEAKLKQDVYSAYYDAKAAAQKYSSTKEAENAAEMALGFAQKRYSLGLVSTIDLLTTKNKAFQSRSDAASAKYDLIFKLKVLDYYLGETLKLN